MATGNGHTNDGQEPETTDVDTAGINDENNESDSTQTNADSKTESPQTHEVPDSPSRLARMNSNISQMNDNVKASATQVKEKALELHEKIQKRRVIVVWAILSAILVVVIIIAGTYAFWQSRHGEEYNYQQLQELAQKPKGMSKTGGLPAFKASDYNPKAPSIDLYVDYFCPGCATVEQGFFRPMKDMLAARQVNLYIHPVNFLDNKTKNHYSTRAASAVAYVASHQPERLFDFSTALYDKTYQPSKDHNRDVSDQEIIDQAVKAGVKESIAENSTKGTYNDYVKKATKYTSSRKELYVTMQDQFRFSTPTICINGKMWQYRQLHTLDDVTPTLINSIGLHREQVGNPKVTPAIGPDGEAIPIQQKYL